MRKRKLTAIAAAALCALAGAAAGISTSSAAKSSSKAKTRHAANEPAGMPGHGPGGPGGHGMAVHGTEVVLNKEGTAYITETEDSGTITSVDASGGSITLKEGTEKVTYATPTITVPSGSTVTLDGKTSSLEALKSGDHVSIRSSSEGTTVFATDSSFKPGEGGPGGGHGWGGPPPGQTSSGETPQA